MSNIAQKNIIRENVIGYIYSQEVQDEKLSSISAFESGEYTEIEIKYIEKIANNYEIFKKLIVQFIDKTWTWNRLTSLNRAILIYGAFELSFNDKPLVIDVLVRYAKEYAPDSSYKFINSILDKIGNYYEKIKTTKKEIKEK